MTDLRATTASMYPALKDYEREWVAEALACKTCGRAAFEEPCGERHEITADGANLLCMAQLVEALRSGKPEPTFPPRLRLEWLVENAAAKAWAHQTRDDRLLRLAMNSAVVHACMRRHEDDREAAIVAVEILAADNERLKKMCEDLMANQAFHTLVVPR